MSTSSSTDQAPGGVYLDAALAARLTDALESIGSAFSRGGSAAPDPARARATRDYDVLRGLLGRAGAPLPLRMRRDRKAVVLVDPAPVAAVTAVVESPGDGRSGPLSEELDLACVSLPNLPLTTITAAMPISRVELLSSAGQLVAFGPSLPPAP
jgi:hypothetical protein